MSGWYLCQEYQRLHKRLPSHHCFQDWQKFAPQTDSRQSYAVQRRDKQSQHSKFYQTAHHQDVRQQPSGHLHH